VYIAVRNQVLSGLGHSFSNVSPATWLLTLPSGLFFYVKHWLFPLRLAINYDLFYQEHLNLPHVLLPAALVIALGYVLWTFRSRLGSREVGYAAAWIVVPLLPALDYMVFKPEELVHDRYFYVPSMGAALLIALLIEKAGKSRRLLFATPVPVIVITFVLTIALAAGTVQATRFWQDDYTLFSHAHDVAPQNPITAMNLSLEHIDRGETDRAQALLEPEWSVRLQLGARGLLKARVRQGRGILSASNLDGSEF
jgi:hypothetical protein